jgi:hypothetical protein
MINNFTKQSLQAKLPSISDELLSVSKQTLAVNNGNIPKWEAAINEKDYNFKLLGEIK